MTTLIYIQGDIHPKILTALKEVYGKKVKLIKEKDDELIDIFKSDWYKKISSLIVLNTLKYPTFPHGCNNYQVSLWGAI